MARYDLVDDPLPGSAVGGSACASPLPAGFPSAVRLAPHSVRFFAGGGVQVPYHYSMYLAIPGPVIPATANRYGQLQAAGFSTHAHAPDPGRIALCAHTAKYHLLGNIGMQTGTLRGYTFHSGPVLLVLSVSITA